MDKKKLAAACDHTLLKQTAVWEDIRELCDEAITYGAASVCIPPYYIAQTKEYVKEKLRICTVIGFPNGYSTTAVKCFETEDAVLSGADEIDMVVNIGMVKSGSFDSVTDEIRAVRSFCEGKILKVIIETSLLTEQEKCRLCKCVIDGGADYIKTSTGFSGGGATFEDVALLVKHTEGKIKVKASGGISTLEDAEKFTELGADRLGTSKVIKLIAKENK